MTIAVTALAPSVVGAAIVSSDTSTPSTIMGKVGIGTASPTVPLDVAASGTAGQLTTARFNGNPGNTGNNYYNQIVLNNTQGTNFQNSITLQGAGSDKFYIQNDFNGSGLQNFAVFDAVGGATRIFVDSSGKVGLGPNNLSPGATLDVAGTTKLGSSGVAFTAMGACTVASYTPTNATANKTCTGVPASTAVAVNCSASAAFTTPASTTIYARATGTASTIAVNLSAANSVAVSLTCTWVSP